MKKLSFILRIFKRPRRKRKMGQPKIISIGDIYNLEEIYRALNAEYFENRIEVPITWFGQKRSGATRYKVLGFYHLDKKIIKIHRVLDNVRFPSFFIEYVVYHEMLHSLFPPLKGRRKRCVHHRTFKEKEREFREFHLAKQWEREHLWQVIASGRISNTAKIGPMQQRERFFLG